MNVRSSLATENTHPDTVWSHLYEHTQQLGYRPLLVARSAGAEQAGRQTLLAACMQCSSPPECVCVYVCVYVCVCV